MGTCLSGQATIKSGVTNGSGSVAGDFSKEAVVFERYETTYRMKADGTGERLVHVVMRVQSEGIAKQFSVLSFSYASANETPHITLIRVHKADGTTVDTPAADAIEMPAQVTREAPLYSDLKEKHVPVRSLAVGDSLEYELDTTIDRAEAPDEFWGSYHLTVPASLVVLDEVLTLEVPKSKYVQVWSPNHKPEITEEGLMRRYRWHAPQLIPAPKSSESNQDQAKKIKSPKDPDEDEDGRKLPSMAWTTFRSWGEVGSWYRGLALERSLPTESLKAKAEEITKDAKSPEEEVRDIYEFVSSRTRYIGIDFGVGRYQPHAAAEVLANQYGDCKDKDTLLEALLKAKGFKTAPALIGAGIAPIPDVPTPSIFNHVITTVSLPGGRVWLDSTPGVAPYGYLVATLRDEPALVIPAEGVATLERTFAAPPYPLEANFEIDATLDKEGKLTGKVSAQYRTDDEMFVREMARNVALAEVDQVSQYVSTNTGFSGTTSETQFSDADHLEKPIGLIYTYTRHPYGDWDNRRIIPPFPWVELSLPGADETEPDADFALGAPRTLVAVAKIRLPEGYTADLPDPVHVKTDFITFDKTYRFDGKEIVIERKIVVLKKKLAKTEWKRYHAFVKDTHLDAEPWIQVIEPIKLVESKPEVIDLTRASGKDASGKVTLNKDGTKTVTISALPSSEPKAKASDTEVASSASVGDADELMRKANALIRARDWDNATTLLNEVKAVNPKEQLLWAGYGLIAMAHRNQNEAKEDFEKETAAYPDNPQTVLALAGVEKGLGDSEGAQKTLGKFLERHPENVVLTGQLAEMQTFSDDNEGALKTLQRGAEHSPEDRGLQIQMSEVLLKLDRKDEAVAAARSALDGTDDPLLLNNAAYVLSQSGSGLTDAEVASRKSIGILETKSAEISTAEVNSNAYAETTLLVSGWDTLGWILFREGNLKDAQPLLMAAWRNGLQQEVGDHLGQLYEAEGKKADALRAYSLAEASMEHAIPKPEVVKHITDSMTRLKKDGAALGKGDLREEMQQSRTYKFPNDGGVRGWGTFRVQIASSGVVGLQQMSGESQLAQLTTVIKGMKFPELLPPDSKARLLRSGVVSCSNMTKVCELVLVPGGSLRTEQY